MDILFSWNRARGGAKGWIANEVESDEGLVVLLEKISEGRSGKYLDPEHLNNLFGGAEAIRARLARIVDGSGPLSEKAQALQALIRNPRS